MLQIFIDVYKNTTPGQQVKVTLTWQTETTKQAERPTIDPNSIKPATMLTSKHN
jgi:hypothetical protein